MNELKVLILHAESDKKQVSFFYDSIRMSALMQGDEIDIQNILLDNIKPERFRGYDIIFLYVTKRMVDSLINYLVAISDSTLSMLLEVENSNSY